MKGSIMHKKFFTGLMLVAGLLAGVVQAVPFNDQYTDQMLPLTNNTPALIAVYNTIPAETVQVEHLKLMCVLARIGFEKDLAVRATNAALMRSVVESSPFKDAPIIQNHRVSYNVHIGDLVQAQALAISVLNTILASGKNLPIADDVCVRLCVMSDVPGAVKADYLFRLLQRPHHTLGNVLKTHLNNWVKYGPYCTLGGVQDVYRSLETQYMPTFSTAAQAAWWGKNVTSKISIISE
jgi:hypothetical protein